MSGGARRREDESAQAYSAQSGDEADAFFGKGDPDGMYPRWEVASTKAEKEAVSWYTGSAYYDLNGNLRSGAYLTQTQKAKVKQLDKAIKKFNLDSDIQVYRGSSAAILGGVTDAATINQLFKGKTIQDLGYHSTSALKSGSFSGSVLFEITVRAGKGKGVWAKPISNFKGENEFLLARGTQFKVNGARSEGGKTVVSLEC